MSNHPQRSGERVNVVNLDGETECVSLPAPFWEAPVRGQQHFTGVWITGLYYGPRTRRMFRRAHSIWDRGDGCATGITYRELALSDFLALCDRVGADVPEGIGAPAV